MPPNSPPPPSALEQSGSETAPIFKRPQNGKKCCWFILPLPADSGVACRRGQRGATDRCISCSRWTCLLTWPRRAEDRYTLCLLVRNRTRKSYDHGCGNTALRRWVSYDFGFVILSLHQAPVSAVSCDPSTCAQSSTACWARCIVCSRQRCSRSLRPTTCELSGSFSWVDQIFPIATLNKLKCILRVRL